MTMATKINQARKLLEEAELEAKDGDDRVKALLRANINDIPDGKEAEELCKAARAEKKRHREELAAQEAASNKEARARLEAKYD